MITDIDNKDFYLCVGSSISISERRDNSKSDTTWNVLWILVKLTSHGPVWIMQKYILKKLSFHYIYKVDFKKRLENISREMYNFLPKVASFYTACTVTFFRVQKTFFHSENTRHRELSAHLLAFHSITGANRRKQLDYVNLDLSRDLEL